MSIGFHLKSLAALAPNKRVSLFFEARHDFSPTVKILDSFYFLKQGSFMSIENLPFSVAAFTNYLR